jgi:DNA repair protein RecN (Recombination protein N)
MLLELRVSQFAIIDSINIEFKKGLNILSGETGSGKSVLLKSLALLMGEKASPDIVRTGSHQATVEGLFDIKHRHDLMEKLNDYGIEIEEKKLLVRRVISSEDKSKVYINGVLSTLTQLKELISPLIEVTGNKNGGAPTTAVVAPLIEMTGQHDNRNLTSKSYHLDLLDQSAGVLDKRQSLEKKYKTYLILKNEIADFEKKQTERLQKLDYLKFQVAEFDKVNLDLVSDFSLEDDIKKLKSSAKILQFTDLADQTIYHDDDSVSYRLKTLLKRAQEFSTIDPDLVKQVEPIEQAMALIGDSVYQLHAYVKRLQLDPGLLEEKEDRLSQIRKLQKKHGPDLKELEAIYKNLKNEVHQITHADENFEVLKKNFNLVALELKKLSEDLHSARTKNATKLAKQINEELNDLNMNGVVFDIQISKLAHVTETGISDVEFVTQTSPRDPFKPIAKVASGGELSRILLALKKSTQSESSKTELPRTYLFDEVDTGVSGPTAEKVGQKLREISQGQQVICVTHLPQVAACGHVHYVIEKSNVNKQTAMSVHELTHKQRISEIARLISGEKISKTSLAHAEQLLKVIN